MLRDELVKNPQTDIMRLSAREEKTEKGKKIQARKIAFRLLRLVAGGKF